MQLSAFIAGQVTHSCRLCAILHLGECIQMLYTNLAPVRMSLPCRAVPGPGGADLDGTGFKTHQVWLVCVRGMGLTSMTEDGDERPFYKFINF